MYVLALLPDFLLFLLVESFSLSNNHFCNLNEIVQLRTPQRGTNFLHITYHFPSKVLVFPRLLSTT